MNPQSKVSWTALTWASLPVPFVLSILLESLSPGKSPIISMIFLFLLTSVLSYAATFLLFLPSLLWVSKFTRLTAGITALLGTVVSGVVWLLMVWVAYRSGGYNSGPPRGIFVDYLVPDRKPLFPKN